MINNTFKRIKSLFIGNSKYSKKILGVLPIRSLERQKYFCDEYQTKGIYALVQLIVQNMAGSRPLLRARVFLEAGQAIRSLSNTSTSDFFILAILAFESDSSEEIRRGHVWLLLQAEQYNLAFEHILYIKKATKEYHSSWDKMEEIVLEKLNNKNDVGINLTALETEKKQDLFWLLDLKLPKILDASEYFFRKILEVNGLEGIEFYLESLSGTNRFIAARYVYIAKFLSNDGDTEGARTLLNKGLSKDISEPTVRGVYWIYKRLGDIDGCNKSLSILEELLQDSEDIKLRNTYEKLHKDFNDSFNLESVKELLPLSVTEKQYRPIEGKICYIAHNSLPYSSGGYATRTHGVAQGLLSLDTNIKVITRPGYPLDIVNNLNVNDIKSFDVIDKISYERILEPKRNELSQKDYLINAVDTLLEKMLDERPAMIIAASNYTTSFPALIVAKKLGIPFIYEVRGFWEITRLSKEPSFEDHPDFRIQKNLESFVGSHADHVLTLTGGMKEELVKRGIDSNNITLFPNSCNPNEFKVLEKDESLLKKFNIPDDVLVIGYIGSFVSYEGLDDLVQACILLKNKGYNFRLLIVGNENASGKDKGPITQSIIDSAKAGGILDWLILPGRIPYSDVEKYYSIIDITPFPRKPWPICEIVSPMKPLEAFSTGKAVIVSSVEALVEMVIDQETGLVFEKGSIASLCDAIALLLEDNEYRQTLSRNGRKWVELNRSWESSASKVSDLLKAFK